MNNSRAPSITAVLFCFAHCIALRYAVCVYSTEGLHSSKCQLHYAKMPPQTVVVFCVLLTHQNVNYFKQKCLKLCLFFVYCLHRRFQSSVYLYIYIVDRCVICICISPPQSSMKFHGAPEEEDMYLQRKQSSPVTFCKVFKINCQSHWPVNQYGSLSIL